MEQKSLHLLSKAAWASTQLLSTGTYVVECRDL